MTPLLAWQVRGLTYSILIFMGSTSGMSTIRVCINLKLKISRSTNNEGHKDILITAKVHENKPQIRDECDRVVENVNVD